MKHELIAPLKEFKEIFDWTYQDMPGLDTEIVVQKILDKPECPPERQVLQISRIFLRQFSSFFMNKHSTYEHYR